MEEVIRVSSRMISNTAMVFSNGLMVVYMMDNGTKGNFTEKAN
jgi:hypothetical protein